MAVEWREGSLTMDGTEQTVVEVTTENNVDGFVDLSPMAAGDTVEFKVYLKIKADGAYRLYETAEFSGEQAKPLVYVHRRPVRYGWKLTARQTAGTYRTFDYQFALTPV